MRCLARSWSKINYFVFAYKKGNRGVYQIVPVSIIVARHEPVHPYFIAPKMERFLKGYENYNEHIVTKLVRFHVEFGGIHPFIDGNGRTGRFLVNLELMKAGYSSVGIKFTDRIAYYNIFDEY